MTLKLSVLRWLVTLVGVQMLAGVLWVLGPLWPPLEAWAVRLVLVMAAFLAWAAANLLLDLARARRDVALAQGVTGAAADEATAVGNKLAAAMALMRKARGRRFALYEQPWYAIIGPPGAGKTTALLNAGLEFPLAGELGPGAIAGVGGTRLCDWWFTNQAVLIDTAGRYTTQDSNRDVDRAGWDAFLALLRRTRPKQPLNGVIVAIALSDVVGDAASAAAHAAAIRARVDELGTRLGVRMPVYLLFTKADLLIGFSEFFDDLDRAAREQVWGATFPLAGAGDVAEALRPLLDRLDRRMIGRLDAEPGPERRALIAGFPAQFASVVGPIATFVGAAFGSGGEAGPLLRGVYLASGTQEGTPIDRLVGGLARSFGLDQRRAAGLRPEAGRSYFLAALLRDVVFNEAMLVAHRPGAARRRTVLRAAGFAACLVAALAGAGLLWLDRSAHADAVARAQTAAAAQARLADQLPLDPVADADFAAIGPWLDQLRAAATGRAEAARDWAGFSQDGKLGAAAEAQYRHGLAFALFPRLVWRAEAQMRGALGQPDALYEATRIYLMLGGAGPADGALLQDWFARDWAATLPGEHQAGLRAGLAAHLAALLAEPLPPIALDGPLVAAARATIGRVPLAARAYSRLKPVAAARALAAWKPADALGSAGVRVFLRLSGRGLEEGVPGLFTVDGFRDAVLPALARAAAEAAAEGWVLGEAIEPDSARRLTLEAEVAGLYAADYIAAWEAMLGDLDPAPLRSVPQAAQDLFILTSPNSPLRNLLASAAKQLAPAAGMPAGPVATAMAAVDQRFQPVRALFGTGGAARIDQLLRPLADLQQQLAKQFTTTTRATPPSPAEDPANALRAEAVRQPQPLGRWLVAFATSGASLRDGGPRGTMISAWNAPGAAGSFCPAVLANRFPFAPAATAEASIEDFTKLLGPGGLLDAFFNGPLKPYVDTSSRPWKLQAVDGITAPLTAADLLQFQRAADIRAMFFPGGAREMLVRFDVTPGALEAGVASATFELGPTTVTAGAGARPAALSWPGRPRVTTARVAAAPLLIEAEGPWALFRLVAKAKATVTGDRTALVFTGNERTVRFDLRASPNPFAGALLAEFRCPAVQ